MNHLSSARVPLLVRHLVFVIVLPRNEADDLAKCLFRNRAVCIERLLGSVHTELHNVFA